MPYSWDDLADCPSLPPIADERRRKTSAHDRGHRSFAMDEKVMRTGSELALNSYWEAHWHMPQIQEPGIWGSVKKIGKGLDLVRRISTIRGLM